MNEGWRDQVTLYDGMLLGARTWQRLAVRRADWLYAQAHGALAPQALTFYTPGNEAGAQVYYETPWHTEHPTLQLSARVTVPAGQYVSLQLKTGSGVDDWTELQRDTTTGAEHWFGGSEIRTYNVSAYAPFPDDVVLVRLWHGLSCPHYVRQAVMTGWIGLPSYPNPMPTFGASAHAAADFNAVTSAQEYLRHCAMQPNLGRLVFTATHTQENAYEPLGFWTFRRDGRQEIYADVTVSGYASDARVLLRLWDDTGTEHVLWNLSANGHVYQAWDVATLGASKGGWQRVELGVLGNAGGGNGAATVTVNSLSVRDLTAGVTRTYAPSPYDALATALPAHMAALVNDANELRPLDDRESPLYTAHLMAPWIMAPSMLNRSYWSAQGFRFTRKWRWLYWRGAAKIVSTDGQYETTLSDVLDGSGAQTYALQVYDLDSVPWLAPDMPYNVVPYGGNVLKTAYEHYQCLSAG
jgi:hypothetical protein